jgi:hypothetical protein
VLGPGADGRVLSIVVGVAASVTTGAVGTEDSVTHGDGGGAACETDDLLFFFFGRDSAVESGASLVSCSGG